MVRIASDATTVPHIPGLTVGAAKPPPQTDWRFTDPCLLELRDQPLDIKTDPMSSALQHTYMETKNKLTIHETPFGHPMYSYVYCLNTESDMPTVLFFGGSVSREVYHLRATSFPENLFACFKTQCSDIPAKLITIPCPYGQIEHDDRPIECMKNVLLDFLKQSNTAPHSIRAMIGNSLGSFWAVGLAPFFTQVKTLITIAGAGMNSALNEAPRNHHPDRVHCYANDNDPLQNMTLAFVDTLQKAGISCGLTTRAGGHSFSDYEKNGSASDAFKKAAAVCR